ncbi:MarR family transcriptional regulator [Nocardia neocaledoniensis NBRC 108232]|uniref:DNA-binding MarR family transcriptional regulator n=1 Tax=Nocardia neocaledoniensis TaxID=236511 RepID=A0A317NID3_9NOCA|nr:DNA-binding MarR family transcriptional regulator [Nocardia neocaledoniensis]GEM31804.1 MarR family transcriptional regulator [Nocardia neocaledoniensis NBRC 108232]
MHRRYTGFVDADSPDQDLLPAADLCALVNRLARQIQDHVHECAATVGLTATQAIALHELGEPLTMRQLAGRMSCEPSNVTFVIDKLENRGLVSRQPHPSDRRAKQLVLSPRGAELRQELKRVMTLESPLGELTDDDRTHLRDLLQRAVRAPGADVRTPA